MPKTTTLGKPPWHLWVVGAVALLWNVAGAYSILMAQAGRLPNPEPDELAYYAAQPLWLVVVTDMALGAAIAGALGLLLRRRIAIWMYAPSLGAIVITNSYELTAGTSRMLANRTALIASVIIGAIAIAELVYASIMRVRGVLG